MDSTESRILRRCSMDFTTGMLVEGMPDMKNRSAPVHMTQQSARNKLHCPSTSFHCESDTRSTHKLSSVYSGAQ
ncbi:hypothetical protein Plhal304r1_c003g0011751 [Plasmopara halstedii]